MLNEKRLLWTVILLLALVTFSPGACADVIYTSRMTFSAAAGNLPVENFETARIGIQRIAYMGNPIDSNTNNAIFLAGEILNGFRALTPNDNNFPALAVLDANVLGDSSKSVWPNFVGHSLDAVFYSGNVTAVGLDLFGENPTTPPIPDAPRTITVYDTIGGVLDSGSLLVPHSGAFFGVISTSLIGRIDVSSSDAQFIGFDNIAFGTAIPEPGSLLQVVLWLSVGAFLVRKQRIAQFAALGGREAGAHRQNVGNNFDGFRRRSSHSIKYLDKTIRVVPSFFRG
jgi:hypothetical protein